MSKNELQSAKEKEFADLMEADLVKDQLAELLGNDSGKTQRFKQRMLKLSTMQGLEKCTPVSIVKVGIQALTLNLPLELGQGYVVKYGAEAQLDVGWKGWQVLAKRDGIMVKLQDVFECDTFKIDGVGYDADITFSPNYKDREKEDDKWARKNILGVLVTTLSIADNVQSSTFVERSTIMKLMDASPSNTAADSKHSPYANWFVEMCYAKAAKYVLSRLPIDIATSSGLSDAIAFTNESETKVAQGEAAKTAHKVMDDEKFKSLVPQWEAIIKGGQRKASDIINQLQTIYSFTPAQLDTLMDMRKHEAIDSTAEEV